MSRPFHNSYGSPHRLATFIFGVALLSQLAQATTYYVSPTGNDHNNGTTSATPFLNISYALSKALDADTILLEDGNFAVIGDWDLAISTKRLTLSSVNGPGSTFITYPDKTKTTDVHHGIVLTGVGTTVTPLVIQGITFQNAVTTTGGGAIQCNNSNVSIRNCKFINNSASQGGALWADAPSNVTVVNSTFTGNTSLDNGGAVYFSNGFNHISGCTFTTNSASGTNTNPDGGALANYGHTDISQSTFDSNSGRYGGAITCGVPYLSTTAATNTVQCIFKNNQSSGQGGALNIGGPFADAGSTFSNNTSLGYGGAIYSTFNYTLANSILFGNTSYTASGGIYNTNILATLTYCTLSKNTGGGGYSGAIDGYFGTYIIKNCIMWNDSPSEIRSGSTSYIYTTSDIQGSSGPGIISVDPLFVNPTANNFQVLGGSPCAGAGTAVASVTTDFLGRIRPTPPTIGAYEAAPFYRTVAQGVGGDGLLRILFAATTGQIAVMQVNANQSTIQHAFGPVAGLSAIDMAVDSTNLCHVLWHDNKTGGIAIWIINPISGVVAQKVSFGPTAGWTETSVSASSNGATVVLWTNRLGKAWIWSVDPTTGAQTTIFGAP